MIEVFKSSTDFLEEFSHYDHNYYSLDEELYGCDILYVHGNSHIGYLYSIGKLDDKGSFTCQQTHYGEETEFKFIIDEECV